MEHLCEEDGEESPGDGGAETDVAPKIKPLVAVIPVFHLEQPLHGPAGDVLQDRRGHDAGEVDQEKIVLKGQGDPQHHDGPRPVEGEKGQAEKAPVDEALFQYGYVGGFKNPPGEAVEIEEREPLVPGVAVHKKPPFVSAFSCREAV